MRIAVQTKTPRLADGEGSNDPFVSVVIPCLNEEENIEACVAAALEAIVRMGVPGEVVVADNNSDDASARLAEQAARPLAVKGRARYRSRHLAGLSAARGQCSGMAH